VGTQASNEESREDYVGSVLVCESEPSGYVRPRDIDTGGTALSGFGKAEVEETALALVKFFQERNLWYQFRPEDFLSFAKSIGHLRGLFGLLGPWWDDTMFGAVAQAPEPLLVYLPGGELCITETFIKIVSDPKSPVGRL